MYDFLHSTTKCTFLYEEVRAHLAVGLLNLDLLLQVLLGKFGRRVRVDVGASSNLRIRSLRIESVTITLIVCFIQTGETLRIAGSHWMGAPTHLTLVARLLIRSKVRTCLVPLGVQRRYLIALVDERHKCSLRSIGIPKPKPIVHLDYFPWNLRLLNVNRVDFRTVIG